jgi:ribonucleoside-diphosphate reductase alpha chain
MPGELFITMAKEGSTIGGLMDSLGTAISVALQYGVPIESAGASSRTSGSSRRA